jgi:replicative DNA helicase
MKEQIPANVDIERAVLGIAITGSMDECGSVEPADFSLSRHQTIWRCCYDLHAAGSPVDQITVVSRLGEAGLHEAGYIVDLTEGSVKANLPGYLKVLKEQTRRRRVLLAAHHLAESVLGGVPVDESLDNFNGSLGAAEAGSGQEISSKDLIASAGVQTLLAGRTHGGLRLPWHRLNNALCGLSGGQMVVLMGATSRGKTSVALQVAAEAAVQGKTPIIWTMEMSPRSLFRRMVNQMSGVAGYTSQLTIDDRASQRDAIGRLDEQPVYFDAHSRTVGSFCASVRRARAKAGVGLAIVDYLQLIRGSGAHSRAEEVSANSRAIKLAAMDLNIPFLVLSQVDRSSVKGGGEIGLHSGKESGDIENDADVVMWIKGGELSRDSETPVTLWIGKQREGAAGFGIPMAFRPQSQTFVEMAE